MLYKTKRQAQTAISCTFREDIAAKHTPEKAIINGVLAGWCLVFHPKGV